MESIAIEMGELSGHWILNSKTEYNSRCKIPRLAISHQNKVTTEDIPHEPLETNEDLTTDDIEKIFEYNKKKCRKKGRDYDHKTNSNHTSSLPASKRRRKSMTRTNCIDSSDGPKTIAKDSTEGSSVSRTDDQKAEHKQDTSNSTSNLFPIFKNPKSRPVLKGKRSKGNKVIAPPQFKYNKISDHFKPQVKTSSEIPNDPGGESAGAGDESLVVR